MNNLALPVLSELPAHALTARLYQIRKEERSLLVEFLAHLAELDRRRIVLALGYPSLFAFCTEFLGLTKASAFRRTAAARLLARFPRITEYLADGRLCLTTLVELRDVLEEARLIEVLDRAAGRTEDQVKELVAALRPQPSMPDLLRRLPTPLPRPDGSSGPAPKLAAPEESLPVAPAAPPAPAHQPEPRARPDASNRSRRSSTCCA